MQYQYLVLHRDVSGGVLHPVGEAEVGGQLQAVWEELGLTGLRVQRGHDVT